MAGRFHPARVARLSGRGSPPIPNGQRLVVGILIGKSARPFATFTRRLAPVTVCLRPGADFTLASATTAAATTATSAAAPRRSVGVAVTVACRLRPPTTFVVSMGFAWHANTVRRPLRPTVARLVEGIDILGIGGPTAGGLFVVEPGGQRTVAAFLTASASAATASATASSAAAFATVVVAGTLRFGGGIAAIAGARLGLFPDRPGSTWAIIRIVTMRPHGLAILLVG